MTRYFPLFAAILFTQVAASVFADEQNADVERFPWFATGQKIQQAIADYHADGDANDEKLRVVYFHGADTKPLADYQTRLSRILFDIQKFYHDEMKRNGFSVAPLPLETEGEQLKLHVVQGAEPNLNYNYRDGRKIKRELRRALQGKIDFDNDFVLVLCGLCQKREDGSYFFHSPYYGEGGSNHIRGLCYAADCEMLDTKHFTATKQSFRYEEHNGTFERTLAAYNSLYIGGIAHELGHGLSLPHNGQIRSRRKQFGTALMGSGNYTYRTELWRGGHGSYMTLASAVRLAAHPLFTQSDRGRFEKPTTTFSDLTFTRDDQRMTVVGRVSGDVPPVAVIAYTDPAGRANYDAKTWVSAVNDGAFSIAIAEHAPGDHALRLTAVLASGQTETISFSYGVDAERRPDTDALTEMWIVRPLERMMLEGRHEEAKVAIKKYLGKHPSGSMADALRHLQQLQDPLNVGPLADVTADHVYLSDVEWAAAAVGWGRPTRNAYFHGGGVRDALLLKIDRQYHAKGLYAHAPSKFTFDLGGRWKTFQVVAGMQAGAGEQSPARFIVKGDGRVLYTSKAIRDGKSVTIELDVTDVGSLELIAESTVVGNARCWSVWGSPILKR